MAVSRALRRLLKIRDLEEEQSRLAMESALGELHKLERALKGSTEWERRGRRLVEASAHSGQLEDRFAGLEESRAAVRLEAVLTPMVGEAEEEVAALRAEYMAKRVEKRQAETLIEEAEARDAIDAGRRSQQALDDWYSNRLHQQTAKLEELRLRPLETDERSGLGGSVQDRTEKT